MSMRSRQTDTLFLDAANKLLSYCPALRIYQLNEPGNFPLAFGGSFLNLVAVQLRGLVVLRQIALLLTKLPSLAILHLEKLEKFTGHQNATVLGTEPLADSLVGIPAPTYHLQQLQLTKTLLTSDQVRWLLSGSETLEELSLRDVEALDLPGVIGPIVGSLELTLGNFAIRDADNHLALTVPVFTKLKSLRLIGEEWPWESLLASIQPGLHELMITWSALGVAGVVAALKNNSWQPTLQKFSILFHEYTDPSEEIKLATAQAHPVSQYLEELCDGRNIALHWSLDRKPTTFANPFLHFDF
ncbi:hypothetical protein B0H15DRAFT_950464 [Mycena belliarum]|uniref:Uncharacterized protein n=1 Tax=Mycena belliarum TaxID=1033014 RepID=A0AAD6U1G4_9AGAR|nr:hypothetical protein B0H15DRAFT_950464 [Mycena belliae]